MSVTEIKTVRIGVSAYAANNNGEPAPIDTMGAQYSIPYCAAVALLGDLALLHDAPGLMLGPEEPRPDLCLVIANNDGGGIFSALEQAGFPALFERVFGTPHHGDLAQLAGAAGLPFVQADSAADLAGALAGTGLRLVEVTTDRAAGTRLRAAISQACAAALG